MPSVATLRRVPVQDRAHRRIEALLAAAEALLVREGAEALTTTRLAAEAGVSVGAVYGWFGDRDAVVEALALRHLEGIQAAAHRVADAQERMPSDDPAAAMLDAIVAEFRSRPAFRALWFGGLRTEGLRDATRPGLEEIARALARALSCTTGWSRSSTAAVDDLDHPVSDLRAGRNETLVLVAGVAVRTADALLREAFRTDPDGDPALLAEARVMLRTYLDHRLGARP